MTSPVISDPSKSHNCVHFGSYSGRHFSIRVQPISKRCTVLEIRIRILLSCCVKYYTFCSLAPKTGLRWTFALYKRSISIFSKTTEATQSNLKDCPKVVHEGPYFLTRNGVVIFSRSATNRVNVSILGHGTVGSRFLLTAQPISKMLAVVCKYGFKCFISCCVS